MNLFNIGNGNHRAWSEKEKIFFRFIAIYFFLQVFPLDWRFYRNIFLVRWEEWSFYQLFEITRYHPQFISGGGYLNWAIIAGVSVGGAALWTRLERKPLNYDALYYWLRVILRYRLALALAAYGLIKLFPLQMPYPSLGNLHTNYGDFLPWKIYYHTLGITPGYESFLGAVELLAAILLLWRKTTTLGAGIILGFTGNVFAANVAYDAGDQVFSAYLFVIALFLFAYDAPRLYRLLVQGKYTYANVFRPKFRDRTLQRVRLILKGGAAVFIVVLSIATYGNYVRDPYKVPAAEGLAGAYGFYNVREFRLNNQNIPYSLTDTNRWQNVVFEKWATLSIKTAKPIKIDLSRGDHYDNSDLGRNYESAGVGGRRYFSYTADTARQSLQLKNKNPNHAEEEFRLTFNLLNDSTIVLSGVNERQDSVYAVLDRINKKYLLQEGRRKRVKL